MYEQNSFQRPATHEKQKCVGHRRRRLHRQPSRRGACKAKLQSSRACALQLLRHLGTFGIPSRSFGTPVTIVRPFNTYGPRQSARAVIPTIISQLLSGVDELKHGSLAPTRDMNYVKDTVDGFILLANEPAAIGEEVNIATGVEISVGELADELIRQINPNARIVQDESRLRPENSIQGLDIQRLVMASAPDYFD